MLLLVGCRERIGWAFVDRMIESEFGSVPAVTTDSLARMIEAEADPVLLDVRTREEYEVSHLPGAVRVDPEGPWPELDSLQQTGRPVVAYCSVGYRSAALTEALRERGVEVVNLEGSIFRWANEGRPLVRGGEQVEVVHPYDRLWGQLLKPRRRASGVD